MAEAMEEAEISIKKAISARLLCLNSYKK